MLFFQFNSFSACCNGPNAYNYAEKGLNNSVKLLHLEKNYVFKVYPAVVR